MGPTLEFFSLVSSHVRLRRGITNENIQIWRNDRGGETQYLHPDYGLYPCPFLENGDKIVKFLTNFGKFVGKALLDSRTLDIMFNSLFLEQVFLSSAPVTLSVLKVFLNLII